MTLREIHHVQITIPKGMEDEARAFYCRMLGLREIPKPESLAGRGGFWLELGEMQIHVGIEDGINRENSKAHVAYLVADLAGWRDKLSDNGIEIIEGIPIPGYKRFEFRDPFGNRVEFLEELADAD
jgi:catechol 2,3-dioxygenase-like lactoylglutathione lyase family enzyme